MSLTTARVAQRKGARMTRVVEPEQVADLGRDESGANTGQSVSTRGGFKVH